jgi:hypothetical protein
MKIGIGGYRGREIVLIRTSRPSKSQQRMLSSAIRRFPRRSANRHCRRHIDNRSTAQRALSEAFCFDDSRFLFCHDCGEGLGDGEDAADVDIVDPV